MFKNPLAPVITEILSDLDPSGEAQISFRQANAHNIQLRDAEAFGNQVRSYTDESVAISRAVSLSKRMEIEARLTMCEPTQGILLMNGRPAFLFDAEGRLAMTAQEFHAAWGEFSPNVIERFWHVCLDANPEWDARIVPTLDVGDPASDSGLPTEQTENETS